MNPTLTAAAARAAPDLTDLSRTFWAMVWAGLPFLTLLADRMAQIPSVSATAPEIGLGLTVGFMGNVAFVPLLAVVHGRLRPVPQGGTHAVPAGHRWRGWLGLGLFAALPLIVFHVAVLFVSLLSVGDLLPRALLATGALAGLVTTSGVLTTAISALASARVPSWVGRMSRIAGVATALLQGAALWLQAPGA